MATKEKELEKLLEGINFKNLTTEQITSENGLLKVLTKRIIAKAMAAEMYYYYFTSKLFPHLHLI